MPPVHDHFDGSGNLGDAETVMGELVSTIPVGLRRIPDQGPRGPANWLFWQVRKFPQLPWLVPAITAAGTCPAAVILLAELCKRVERRSRQLSVRPA